MPEVISFPIPIEAIQKADEEGLKASGRSWHMATDLESFKNGFAQGDSPVLVICDLGCLEAIRNLAWGDEKFSALKRIPMVVVFNDGDIQSILQQEQSQTRPMHITGGASVLDYMRPQNIAQLINRHIPQPVGRDVQESLDRSRSVPSGIPVEPQ